MSGLVRRGRICLLLGLRPASQVSSHVGNVGVGVISLRGAFPTFATAQFKMFF